MWQAQNPRNIDERKQGDEPSGSEVSSAQFDFENAAAELEIELGKHSAEHDGGKQICSTQLSQLRSSRPLSQIPSEHDEVNAASRTDTSASLTPDKLEATEKMPNQPGAILQAALSLDCPVDKTDKQRNSAPPESQRTNTFSASRPRDIQKFESFTRPTLCAVEAVAAKHPDPEFSQSQIRQGRQAEDNANPVRISRAAMRMESMGPVYSPRDVTCSDIVQSPTRRDKSIPAVVELAENTPSATAITLEKVDVRDRQSNEASPRGIAGALTNDGQSNPAPLLKTLFSLDVSSEIRASQKPLTPAQEVAILIDRMLEAPDNMELNMRALRSMRRISTHDEGRRLIGESGGIQIVADCMRRLGNNTQLATVSCMVIANLCFNSPVNKLRVYKSRVIDSIVGFLDSVNSGDQVAFACLALRNISNNCKENQIFLGACGGVDGLCKVMKNHLEHVDVMTQASAAIGNIASGNKSCQMRVRECDGLELLVQSMKTHPTSAAIQEQCMIALENVSRGNEKNQKLVGTQGGVDKIVLAMRSFKELKNIQVRGCAVLRILAFDEQNRERLGVNGGIACIVAALKLLMGSNSDVEIGLKALSNATYDHAENKNAVVRCGGIDVVLSLLLISADSDVKRECLRAFRNLTDYSADVRSRLCRDGALQAGINCLRQSGENVGVAEHAIAFVLNLLSDAASGDSPTPQLDKQGLAGHVQVIIEHFPQNEQIQLHGPELLGILRRLRNKDTAEVNPPSRHIVDRLKNLRRKMSNSTRTASESQ